MMVMAILSSRTCGEACWQAREDVCKCSCYGRNHGCDRDGTRPYRTCQRTIKPEWASGQKHTYKLVGVIPPNDEGGYYMAVYRDAEQQARDLIAEWEARYASQTGDDQPVYRSDDPRLPAFSRFATETQQAKWAEVSALNAKHRPILVWAREDIA